MDIYAATITIMSKNSISLAEDLTNLTINANHKMMTYYIKDLWEHPQYKKRPFLGHPALHTLVYKRPF